ncbi:hypothetical protein AB205_0141290, partial [Aquarana catesbeiana]
MQSNNKLNTCIKMLDKTQKNVHLLPNLVSSETIKNAINSQSKYKNIQVVCKDNITTIVMKRPEKKNALSMEAYKEISDALEEAGKDDSVIAVLTGYGDYFSSGNDLNNALGRIKGNLEDMIKESTNVVRYCSLFSKSAHVYQRLLSQ